MISVEKAARLLVDVAEGGRGVKGIHLAVEEPPLSTADIIRGIRARKGMSPWLFPLPVPPQMVPDCGRQTLDIPTTI